MPSRPLRSRRALSIASSARCSAVNGVIVAGNRAEKAIGTPSKCGLRPRPCCRRPIRRHCCSGRCSPLVKSTCARLTVGRPSPPHNKAISRLTSPPDSVLSKCRRSRQQIPTQFATALFRQYKRISTQHYGDGRKDNSRCKLRDLFYFWCGLLLAWRRRQRRWLLGWLRR
jgi:hypothetical protein